MDVRLFIYSKHCLTKGTAGEPPKMIISELGNVNNPISIHGIYPYRGKISALEAEGIISQFKSGDSLLDPFCGSGTIVYEAMKNGHRTFGVDANPIAVLISNGKIEIRDTLDQYLIEADRFIMRSKKVRKYDFDIKAAKHFHIESFKEIQAMSRFFDEMSPYLKACFIGSIALVARGCNEYMWTSSTVGKDINPKRYINAFEKLKQKIKKHYFPLKNRKGEVFLGDARKVSNYIKPNSIDVIFTSPPYFDCLDYTAYYARLVYSFLNIDHLKVKTDLIQQFSTYKIEMKTVMNELDKVLVPGGKVIFVVGDKKVHGELIQGESFFDELSPWTKLGSVDRVYKGTSSTVFDNINNTKRREQVMVWQKER